MADSPNTPDGFPAGKQNPPQKPKHKRTPLSSAAQDSQRAFVPDRLDDKRSVQLSEKSIEALSSHTQALERVSYKLADFTHPPEGKALFDSVRYNESTVPSQTSNNAPTIKDWHNSQSTDSTQQRSQIFSGAVSIPDAASIATVKDNKSKEDEFPGRPIGKDTVPVWLSPGEFVVNAEATKKNRDALEQINKSTQPQTMALGGSVGDNQPYYRASGGGFNFSPVSTSTAAGAIAGDPKDIAKAIAEALTGVVDGMKDIAQGFGKATLGMLSQDRLGNIASSPFRGAEQGLHGARGIFGQYNPNLIALEKAAGFAATLFESVETLRKFNDQLIQSNISFAEHSAAMTQVEVSMERFKIEMDQVRGARRSQTALFHAESVQRLERSFAKWEDAWANLKGGILGEVNTYLAGILETINKWFGFKDDNQNLADGLTKEAMDAYNEVDWINQFGRLPANQNAHPRTPRV